jgi:hypothetical protein
MQATAVIPVGQLTSVIVNISPTVNRLEINGSTTNFTVPTGSILSIGGGGLLNQASIAVNPSGLAGATGIHFLESSEISGSGEIVLSGIPSSAFLSTAQDAIVSIGPQQTVRGRGAISGSISNDGAIIADSSSGQLRLQDAEVFNQAIIGTSNAGQFFVRDSRIVNAPSGSVICLDGTAEFQRAEIEGGTLRGPVGPGSSMFFRLENVLTSVATEGILSLSSGSTVFIFGDILDNSGQIVIEPVTASSTANLHFAENTTLQGPGLIALRGSGIGAGAPLARLTSAPDAWVTVPVDHTISGYGHIEANLVNESAIVADTPGQQLRVLGQVVNNGVLRSDLSSELNISGAIVDQTNGGLILSEGGLLWIGGGEVHGGIIRNASTNQPGTTLWGPLLLRDVTLEGAWNVSGANAVISVGGSGLDNLGTLLIGGTSTLRFEEDGELRGPGVLECNVGGAIDCRIETAPGATLTHAAGHVIRGEANIAASLVNHGEIIAEGFAMRFTENPKVNHASIRAQDGGVLLFRGTVMEQSDEGYIAADGGGVRFRDNFELRGGTLLNSGLPDSDITIENSSTFEQVRVVGEVILPQSRVLTVRGQDPRSGDAITLDGLLMINPTDSPIAFPPAAIYAPGQSSLGGDGEIRLMGTDGTSRISNDPEDLLVIGPNLTVSGIGRIDAELRMDGVLAPGLGVGTMFAARPVSFSEIATLQCDLDPDGPSDRFESSATVDLGGTLSLRWVDDAEPSGNSPLAFEILTASGGITGRFDSVVGAGLPAPLVTRVVYEPNRVRVGFVCPGDANLDGSIDLGDLNEVLANFGTSASLGDVTGDGEVNLADLNLVLATFGTDCLD